MDDEGLLDLDTLTALFGAEDTEPEKGDSSGEIIGTVKNDESQTANDQSTTSDLEGELKAMREKIKLLENQLQKKSCEKVAANVSKTISISEQKSVLARNKDARSKDDKVMKSVSATKLKLVEKDIFAASAISPSECNKVSKLQSLVHHDDSDTASSDDERKRNNEGSNLNKSGQEIKKLLHVTNSQHYDKPRPATKPTWKSSFQASPSQPVVPAANPEKVETDAFSGLRIRNPLVCSSVLRDRMAGRKMLRLSLIHRQIIRGDIDGDWVTIGVIIHKSDPKTSKNGKTFSIWKMNDLQDLNTFVSLFLFGDVHQQLWKTSVGTVVGLLNARIMPDREDGYKSKSNVVALTLDHPGKVMIVGQSKDFGTCKGQQRSGGPCHNLVNMKDCEFCEYHVQAEYKRAGRRMELQSSYSGMQPKNLRNPSIKAKILNKNGVMYGGQLYTVPLSKPEPSNKGKEKDRLRLSSLTLKQKALEVEQSTRSAVTAKHLTEKENKAVNGISSSSEFLAQRLTLPTAGSRNLIRHLIKEESTGTPVSKTVDMKSVTPKQLLQMHKSAFDSLKRKRSQMEPSTPSNEQLNSNRRLSVKMSGFDLELTPGTPSGNVNMAKLQALSKLSQNPIKREDPNSVRKKRKLNNEQAKKIIKRVEEGLPSSLSPESKDDDGCSKKISDIGLLSSRLGNMSKDEIERILKMKSSHCDEVDQEELLNLQKYFNTLEKKEQLELKMQSVTEITCSVVSCSVCKYTAQQASDLCMNENHKLKRHKAQKRFFKCVKCQGRMFSFNKLPTKSCRNCGASNFERTGMMRPRAGPKLDNEQLLIRGEELKFIK